ncbi:unnamed protein product, partial [Phaeothamnion confervicola]
LAVELGNRHDGDVCFIATAEPFDDDMRERIDRHIADRPSWPTIEEPIELAVAVGSVPAGALVIVDCITVWLGNLFHHLDDSARAARTEALVDALSARTDPTVVISNEVGMGLVSEHALGRRFTDALGKLNTSIAAIADRSLLIVAGRALQLQDPWELR